MQWRNFAVWELRSALEEEVDEDTLEYRISIVKEWILHAGTRIFEEARTMYSDDSDVLKPGSLYKGPPGLNLQRWNFWKTRLATISRQSPGAVSIRAEAILWLMKHPEV